MAQLSLTTSVEDIFMIGPAYAQRLKKLNLLTAQDILHHYPSRHQDLSLVTTIAKLQPGETATIKGEIVSCQNIFTRSGKKIQKAVIQDSTGSLEAVWFNQTFIPQTLKPGSQVSLSGPVKPFNSRLSLASPEYELIKPKSPPVHTGRLVPVYPETAGLSSKWLRSRIKFLLDKLAPQLKADWLPQSIKSKYKLIDLRLAIKQIHFPDNQSQLDLARQRLAFNEMFLLQLEALIRKRQWQQKKLTHPLQLDQEQILQFIASLPFKLTSAQNQAIKEILADLSSDQPMNRLLQGDVGSGKTVVAATAIYLAYLNGCQSFLMAPTEILAQQHYQTLKTVFADTPIRLRLVTASTPKTSSPKPVDVLIGTHALLYRQLKSKHLALVIIDEQHRFGVKQRSQLTLTDSATKLTPHLLTMTATPIPRTVALTAYGDLNLSVLDKMPPGRQPIKTWVVPPAKRLSAYHWINQQIQTHQSQAFIVCPLIEQSDKETMKDIKAVTSEFDQLQQIFDQLKLGLLHGRLKSAQKDKIVQAFRRGKIDLLISTPVIEVGIDIPNATIMLIEDADRFGLAQLHQLRGRVGRGDKPSHCLLFTNSRQPKTIQRLKHLETINSGLQLAEIDLQLRGPGHIFGLKQHGFLDLQLASFSDSRLITHTRQAASGLIDSLPAPLKKLLKQRKISAVAPN